MAQEFNLFETNQPTSLDIYRGSQDPDQRALVLNEQIVNVEDGIASPASIRTLTLLFTENAQISIYRSQVITGLNSENLVAIANGLAQDPETDPLSTAEEEIRKALLETDLQNPIANAPVDMQHDIFAELAERLEDHNVNPQERADLIEAVDSTITEGLLRKIAGEHPLVFAALMRNREEFSNQDLRIAIERLGLRLAKRD